jgi:hypothetical protein
MVDQTAFDADRADVRAHNAGRPLRQECCGRSPLAPDLQDDVPVGHQIVDGCAVLPYSTCGDDPGGDLLTVLGHCQPSPARADSGPAPAIAKRTRIHTAGTRLAGFSVGMTPDALKPKLPELLHRTNQCMTFRRRRCTCRAPTLQRRPHRTIPVAVTRSVADGIAEQPESMISRFQASVIASLGGSDCSESCSYCMIAVSLPMRHWRVPLSPMLW